MEIWRQARFVAGGYFSLSNLSVIGATVIHYLRLTVTAGANEIAQGLSMEPASIGLFSALFGIVANFFQHFKASRAPYLFVGITCVVCLLFLAEFLDRASFALAAVPFGAIFAIFCGLTFVFRPYERKKISTADVALEIDDQFKFARTLCMTVGVVMIVYLFYSSASYMRNGTIGAAFWFAYLLCIVYLLTFAAYIVLWTNYEETNLSVLQIGFFTISAFVGTIVAIVRVQRGVDLPSYESNVLLSYYFFLVWSLFQTFWTVRLWRTVNFTVRLGTSDQNIGQVIALPAEKKKVAEASAGDLSVGVRKK